MFQLEAIHPPDTFASISIMRFLKKARKNTSQNRTPHLTGVLPASEQYSPSHRRTPCLRTVLPISQAYSLSHSRIPPSHRRTKFPFHPELLEPKHGYPSPRLWPFIFSRVRQLSHPGSVGLSTGLDPTASPFPAYAWPFPAYASAFTAYDSHAPEYPRVPARRRHTDGHVCQYLHNALFEKSAQKHISQPYSPSRRRTPMPSQPYPPSHRCTPCLTTVFPCLHSIRSFHFTRNCWNQSTPIHPFTGPSAISPVIGRSFHGTRPNRITFSGVRNVLTTVRNAPVGVSTCSS
jgi:hypothetical protein